MEAERELCAISNECRAPGVIRRALTGDISALRYQALAGTVSAQLPQQVLATFMPNCTD